MAALKFGVDVASWPLPLKPALFTAAELGVEGVVLDARGQLRPEQFGRTAVRQFRKTLEDLRLQVAALRFRSRRGYAAPEELDRRVHATRAALDLAYQLGASVVVGAIGPIPAEGSETRQLLVEVLRDLGHYGHRAGATLATETGGESGEVLAKLLAELPEGSLGIDFNPGQLIVGGYSPSETLDLLAPSVLHVSALDGLASQGGRRGVLVTAGEGSVDFPALLGRLDEQGYRGWLSIAATEADRAIGQSGAALRFLRSL